MFNPSLKKNITAIIFVSLIVSACWAAYAQTPTSDVFDESGQEMKSSLMSEQAREYRARGYKYQQLGNIREAMGYYKKAIECDPAYAVPYNDLGVLYEANGNVDLAEQNYLQAIKIDPTYLSAYSNLAMLYEGKRDLNRAAFFWQKRAYLGSPDDPWTDRARHRLEDIRLVLGKKSMVSREQQILDLANAVSSEKALLRQDDKANAKYLLDKAKQYYQRGENILALKEAINARQLDPSNSDIDDFIEKVQTRLLTN